MKKLINLGLLFSLLMIVSLYSPATPQSSSQTIVQYAAKFVCGKSDGKIAAPGQYFTIINVHNPNSKEVTFRKRFALGEPGEKVGDVTRVIHPEPLPPDHVMGIDCPDIYKHTNTRNGDFIEGYVVLYSPAELDVVSVFTAGDNGVATLHTERVPFRRSAFPSEVCSDLDLSLNTGVTPWRIVADPISATIEPRAASLLTVVGTAPPFPPLTGSSWIGPFPNAGIVPVNRGQYVYEFTFCLCPGFSNAKLNLEGLSVDPAKVTLNGLTLGTIPNSNSVTTLPTATTGFIVGTNTLFVIVENRENSVTGINIRGSVTATAGACPAN